MPPFACSALFLAASWAHAGPSLAVLPLDPAGETEAYPGLGRALAGMIVTDLSGIDGLDLVERDHLDAVLAEIALGRSGFLDPATAAELGHGLGADALIVGTWTILSGRLSVDARVVDSASGAILAAASASGDTADFVAVEKDVVAGLLTGLAIELGPGDRRRLTIAAPTEVFDAFAAYGEGLDHRASGDLDAAREAFARAISADPAYRDARRALATLDAALDAATDAEQEALGRAAADARAAALAATEGARARRPTAEDMGRWLVRWHVLWLEGRHCERKAEIEALLDGVDWDPSRLPNGWAAAARIAFETGLDTPRTGDGTHPEDPDLVAAAGLFLDHATLLLGPDATHPGHPRSQSLLASALRCLPPEAWVPEIASWEARARRHGFADTAPDPEYPTWTTRHHLATTRGLVQATWSGLDPGLADELAALLDDPSLDAGGRAIARLRLEAIERAARQTHLRQIRLQGLPDDVILGLARAVAAGDPDRIDRDASGCRAALETATPRIGPLLDAADSPPWDLTRASALADLSVAVAPLLDLGCVRGLPAAFPTLADLVAHVRSAPDRRDPTADASRCDAAFGRLPLEIRRAQGSADPEGVGRARLAEAYRHQVYRWGCVGLERR